MIRALILIIAVTGCATILFQNCSGQMETPADENASSTGLPFAYDTTIDTIAYMSCAGSTVTTSSDAIFSILAGAFGSTSGVRLTSSYLAATGSMTLGSRAAALTEGEPNKGVVAQLAIRQNSNLQNPFKASSSAMAGRDFATLAGALDSPDIAYALTNSPGNPPARINFFSKMAGLTGRDVRGAISFTKSEGEAQAARSTLLGTGLLTVTYTNEPGGSAALALSESTVNNRVYGRSYKLSLMSSSGDPEPRILSGVQEVDLAVSGAETAAWTCPSNMVFRVARSCAECSCTTDPAANSVLAQIRKVLKVEHWYVNQGAACIVQKGSQTCYPSTATTSYNFVSVCVRP
jgi:hypothetical protein